MSSLPRFATRQGRIALALATGLVLTTVGCGADGWWNRKPTELAAGVAAIEAKISLAQEVAALAQAEVARLNASAYPTPEELAILARLEGILLTSHTTLASLEAALIEWELKFETAATNGDVVLTTVGAVGTTLGIPLIGLLVGFLKRGSALGQLITNVSASVVDKKPRPDGVGSLITLDGTVLKGLNISTGLEKKITKVRSSEPNG